MILLPFIVGQIAAKFLAGDFRKVILDATLVSIESLIK
jgi:hypothetical protein